jgi:hypothetical protein
MAFVSRSGKSFSLEDVAQMTITIGANDLSPRRVHGAVLLPLDSSWYRVKEGRPATTRIKFGAALVERSVTPGTVIYALSKMFIVLASAGSLSALLAKDPELLRGK